MRGVPASRRGQDGHAGAFGKRQERGSRTVEATRRGAGCTPGCGQPGRSTCRDQAIFAALITPTMPQDQRTQLNRKRKAAKKLAEWKEGAATAPKGKRAPKKAAKKD